MVLSLKDYAWPLIAVVAGGTAAVFGFGNRGNSAPAAVPVAAEAERNSAPKPNTDSVTTQGVEQAIQGEVLERIDVDKYTYLRVGERDTAGTWTAVPSTTVPVGSRVRVKNAELMTDFASATLKRTFEAIYFGVLDDTGTSAPKGAAVAAHGAGAEPHAGVAQGSGADPHAGMAMPTGSNTEVNPHATGSGASDSVAVGKVERAGGPNGRSVAELYAQRTALGGKTARVRGVVVKSVGGVLGRTFLHIRDGSGDAKAGSNDVTVTTMANPAVGTRALFEGRVAVDKDFGSGYRYPVLLEDAQIVQE